jgi:hypothetical protein
VHVFNGISMFIQIIVSLFTLPSPFVILIYLDPALPDYSE